MRILAFGDDIGVPQLFRHMPADSVVGIVCASIRPYQQKVLRMLAKSQGVPLLIQPRATENEYSQFLEDVRNLKPDIIFVNSYSMLLRNEILSIPPLGGVNIHGALLPQYRGANPIQWVIINGEFETGVTMHYMDAHFDTGDILAQRRVPILIGDTWVDLQHRITEAAEQILSEELPKILNNTIVRKPQDESCAHHYHRRKPEDGLFTWDANLINIYNLIRALVKPHPGAFYFTGGGDRIVLDEYVSLPKLAIMKYGTEGGKTLKTINIKLQPVTDDYLEKQKEYEYGYSNELCIENQANQAALNQPLKVWFESILQRNDILIFEIHLRTSGKYIGSCQLHNISLNQHTAELQIHTGHIAEHGHEYSPQIISLLLDFAFKDLNLNRVYLHVFSNNAAAIRVYEKAGFVREGILRQAAHIDGKYLDVMVMGILRQEL